MMIMITLVFVAVLTCCFIIRIVTYLYIYRSIGSVCMYVIYVAKHRASHAQIRYIRFTIFSGKCPILIKFPSDTQIYSVQKDWLLLHHHFHFLNFFFFRFILFSLVFFFGVGLFLMILIYDFFISLSLLSLWKYFNSLLTINTQDSQLKLNFYSSHHSM